MVLTIGLAVGIVALTVVLFVPLSFLARVEGMSARPAKRARVEERRTLEAARSVMQ
jgi:hypothetical protein